MDKPAKKKTNIFADVEIHRQMRIRAAEQGTTLTAVWEAAARAYLDKPKPDTCRR